MKIATVLFVVQLAVLLGGGAFLQWYLSRRDSWWPGLILPGITFLYALLLLLDGGILLYENMLVQEIVWLIVGGLLYANIPTIFLLTIYFLCKRKRRVWRQLDKMNIQDLE